MKKNYTAKLERDRRKEEKKSVDMQGNRLL